MQIYVFFSKDKEHSTKKITKNTAKKNYHPESIMRHILKKIPMALLIHDKND